MSTQKPILYGYEKSSTTNRIRIALALKSIDYEFKNVDLWKDEHLKPDYLKINPCGEVPVLVIDGHNLIQSVAILEYLEDARPENTRLLPQDPYQRAVVRQIVEIINSGIQPLLNRRVVMHVASKYRDPALKELHSKTRGQSADKKDSKKASKSQLTEHHLKFVYFSGNLDSSLDTLLSDDEDDSPPSSGTKADQPSKDQKPAQSQPRLLKLSGTTPQANRESWPVFWIERGLKTLETLLASTHGTYCFGDALSLADVFFVPQIIGARMYGVDLNEYPTVEKVYRQLCSLPAFQQVHPPHLPPESSASVSK